MLHSLKLFSYRIYCQNNYNLRSSVLLTSDRDVWNLRLYDKKFTVLVLILRCYAVRVATVHRISSHFQMLFSSRYIEHVKLMPGECFIREKVIELDA